MIIDIVYGFPSKKMCDDATSNKINLGGCIKEPNNPDHKCKSCGYEFKELDKFFKN
tara:strand:+ start:469 stop:636 length:168 start_codon:yes stop_codon:yes gene_type:complete